MIKKIALVCSLVFLGVSCADDESADGSLDSPMSSSESAASSFFGEGESSGKAHFVRVPHLYVRSGPGMEFAPVGTVPFNKELKVLEIVNGGGWAKIGENQYVGAKYISTTKNAYMWIPKKYAH